MTPGRRLPGAVTAAGLLAVLGACGAPTPAASVPDPGVVVPQLFEPSVLYRELGFLAGAAPVPFIGSVRFLASDTPDTTLVLVGLSLASDALGFRRAGAAYEARYAVDLTLWRDGTLVDRTTTLERVRVATRQETRRADESIVFQGLLRLVPGPYDFTAAVRDEETGAFSRAEAPLMVPRFSASGMTEPVPVYQAGGRDRRAGLPTVLMNPRATVPFGRDTLSFYVEIYGAAAPAPVWFALQDSAGHEVARRDVAAAGDAEVAWAVASFGPDALPVGRLLVLAGREGAADTVRSTVLVTFSDLWAITNFDDVLSLLRWFGWEREREEMRAADPGDRPTLWREFWKATDPNPATPQNEALERYFRRVQEANLRFAESGEPGWLTERGEVYVALGDPDEAFDVGADFMDTQRTIRWMYAELQLTLDFVDETGFGRFRLTPGSRADFERVRARRRDGR